MTDHRSATDQSPTTTLPAAFLQAVERGGKRVALREKVKGVWCPISWSGYGTNARRCGLGLISLGLERGESVGILGENSPRWLFADMGVLGAGGVSVGIYTTSSAEQIEYLINDAKVGFVFADDREQLDKILKVRERTPSLKKIIVFDDGKSLDLDDPMVLQFDALMETGQRFEQDNPGSWENSVRQARPDDLAILVYTSGTTGAPKGAMLSHRNLIYQCAALNDIVSMGEDDELTCYLPLSHIGERVMGDYRPMLCGAGVNFVESQDKLVENMRELPPSIFLGVPRVWEKFYGAISSAMNNIPQRWAFRLALFIGDKVARRKLEGGPVPMLLSAIHRFAEFSVLRPARKLVGMQRARFVITGAAPIAPDLVHWYLALGLNMGQTYGLTETAGAASHPATDRLRPGTAGQALPGSEIRIADDGEILVQGPLVFQGYLNRPEQTDKALIDGWLHTGDLGRLDEEGFLTITGRKKDIIITAGGKNISPAQIENQLKFSPYIADAMVVGDSRKYLSCLIMLNYDNAAVYAKQHGIVFSDFAGLCRAVEIVALIEDEIDQVNSRFARPEQIKVFRLLETPLTPMSEEVTPTMKLKRDSVQRKYRDLIESMYRDNA